ncbi:hypothetical protein PMI30_06141 [Pseudomonas sp. GM50]|nr:hypothetical protein PMI30_06141 [Pseudomonas sp. GM50]
MYTLNSLWERACSRWRQIVRQKSRLAYDGHKKNGDHFGDRRFLYVLSNQGINTSIAPSAVMLTWLVPASTSGVTGAESMPAAAFIIIGPRMYGCG